MIGIAQKNPPGPSLVYIEMGHLLDSPYIGKETKRFIKISF